MNEHEIAKGLEVWLLQNLLNGSILMGLVSSGLMLAGGYFDDLERHLKLRVSRELWRLLTVVMADLLLAGVLVIGYAVLNPDIMADIKMAVPFYPLATLLFAAALVLRLFKGGHDERSPNHRRALWLTVSANLINIIGFTFVAEAASGEYLAHYASPFWTYLKTHFRSNADPIGLEVSMVTFLVCFPLLVMLGAWGVRSALGKMAASQPKD